MTGSASFSGTHPSLSLSSLSRGERAFERESESKKKRVKLRYSKSLLGWKKYQQALNPLEASAWGSLPLSCPLNFFSIYLLLFVASCDLRFSPLYICIFIYTIIGWWSKGLSLWLPLSGTKDLFFSINKKKSLCRLVERSCFLFL